MPIISQFYGIIITMYTNEENIKHHKSHIHVKYNKYKAIYDFNCNMLAGKIPYKQKKLVEAWILIHKDELIKLWDILQEGKGFFKIDPLE